MKHFKSFPVETLSCKLKLFHICSIKYFSGWQTSVHTCTGTVGPQLSGFLDNPDIFSDPNFFMNIY